MTANSTKQQAQPQTGPIAQQLAKLQTNGHQPLSSGHQPSAGQLQKNRFNWGFADKKVWDWLMLIAALVAALGAIAVPFVIYNLGQNFTQQQAQLSIAASEKQHQTDLQIAEDQQQEVTLQTYLDRMSDLLLIDNLRASKPSDEVRNVARTRTLTALLRLNPTRKGILLHFLFESDLINSDNTIVDLHGADLSGISLNGQVMARTTLYIIAVRLDNIDLSGAFLNNTNLSYIHMSGANLSGAFLNFSQLDNANLSGADLSGAFLDNANLSGADLSDANLSGAFGFTQRELDQVYSCTGAILPKGLACHRKV